jgi:periplasmic divalent cation tolerance protein
MSKLKIVYSTFPNQKAAQVVADLLVEEKLAACVVLVPSLSSTYKWKGKLETSKEVLLIAKTLEKKTKKLIKRLEHVHPYECPCVLSFGAKTVNSAYMKWMREQL